MSQRRYQVPGGHVPWAWAIIPMGKGMARGRSEYNALKHGGLTGQGHSYSGLKPVLFLSSGCSLAVDTIMARNWGEFIIEGV